MPDTVAFLLPALALAVPFLVALLLQARQIKVARKSVAHWKEQVDRPQRCDYCSDVVGREHKGQSLGRIIRDRWTELVSERDDARRELIEALSSRNNARRSRDRATAERDEAKQRADNLARHFKVQAAKRDLAAEIVAKPKASPMCGHGHVSERCPWFQCQQSHQEHAAWASTDRPEDGPPPSGRFVAPVAGIYGGSIMEANARALDPGPAFEHLREAIRKA